MYNYSIHQHQANAEPEIQNRIVSNEILAYLYDHLDKYGKIDFVLDEVQIDTVLLNLNGESSDLFHEISEIAKNDNRILERTIINQQYITIDDQSYIFAKSIKFINEEYLDYIQFMLNSNSETAIINTIICITELFAQSKSSMS